MCAREACRGRRCRRRLTNGFLKYSQRTVGTSECPLNNGMSGICFKICFLKKGGGREHDTTVLVKC